MTGRVFRPSKKIKWKCGCWIKDDIMFTCRKHLEHPNAR